MKIQFLKANVDYKQTKKSDLIPTGSVNVFENVFAPVTTNFKIFENTSIM